MRVGDGDGERVGGVVARRVGLRQKDTHHRLDLPLLGVPGADDRLLDEVGGIFRHRKPGERRDQERDAAGMAELQRRLRIAVDESLLDGDLVRGKVGDDCGKAVMELAQALGERRLLVRDDGPAGHEGKPRALDRDEPPAGAAKAGVDAENADRAHTPIFAIAASETSKFTNTFCTSSWSSSDSTRRMSFSAASSSPSTVFWARQTRADFRGSPNRASSAFVTSPSAPWSQYTSCPSGLDTTSSAPASIAASSIVSASGALASKATTPTRSNMKATAPVSAKLPPLFVNTERMSEAVRLRLSVIASTISAAPPGP